MCAGVYGLLMHLEFDGAKPFTILYSDSLFLQQLNKAYRTVYFGVRKAL